MLQEFFLSSHNPIDALYVSSWSLCKNGGRLVVPDTRPSSNLECIFIGSLLLRKFSGLSPLIVVDWGVQRCDICFLNMLDPRQLMSVINGS